MTIQLIKGSFSPTDALDIITRMIQVKIQYHENKISLDHDTEDIKSRERKIKSLQNDLHEIRKWMKQTGENEQSIQMESQISFQFKNEA